MTAEAKVSGTFGGNTTASTDNSGTIYQSPGIIDIDPARTAANGKGPLIITDLYGYVSQYNNNGVDVSLRLGGSSGAKTATFTPSGNSSSSSSGADSTGWKTCTTTKYYSDGASNLEFAVINNTSFGCVVGRNTSSGTVKFPNIGDRTGRLGGGYKYIQSPAAPATPTLSLSNYRTVSVSWVEPLDGGDAIDGYDLQYSTSSTFASGVSTVALTGTGTSWSSSSLGSPLAYGTRYYFRVAAKNAVTTAASTTSVYSSGANVWTAPATPTSFVSGSLDGVSTPATSSSVALDWSGDTTGVTRYRVSYKRTSESTWTDSGYSGLTSATTVTGLSANTLYNFRVSAENGNATGSSVSSDYATLNASTLPATVTGLTVSGYTSSQVGLTWNSIAGITNYIVEYKASADSVWLSTSYTGTTTSFTQTGLAFNTSYDFRVAAQNSGAGTTGAYATVTQSTLPGGPPIRSNSTTWSPSEIRVCEVGDEWPTEANASMYVWDGTEWKVVG